MEGWNPCEILNQIEARAVGRPKEQQPYVAPRTQIEGQLCEIWQQLLHVERVGIHDDFFALGGTSLLAVRLFAQLEKLTGKKLPLVTLFRAPTVEKLAKVVESGANVFEQLIVTVEHCSLGQITERLHEVVGHYRPTV